MSTIHLTTIINADVHKVFDLARDIDLHQKSTFKTNEKAIAGRISGFIEKGETVTWRSTWVFIKRTLQKSSRCKNLINSPILCWKERLNRLNISIFLKRMPIQQL